MTRLLVILAVLGFAADASAQGKSAAAPASTAGTAGVKTRLQALHYTNIHGLRRGPDGQWVGEARQNGVPKMVTIAPDGTVTAR